MFVQFILRFSRDACFHVNSIRFFFFFAFCYFFCDDSTKWMVKWKTFHAEEFFFCGVCNVSLCVYLFVCMLNDLTDCALCKYACRFVSKTCGCCEKQWLQWIESIAKVHTIFELYFFSFPLPESNSFFVILQQVLAKCFVQKKSQCNRAFRNYPKILCSM